MVNVAAFFALSKIMYILALLNCKYIATGARTEFNVRPPSPFYVSVWFLTARFSHIAIVVIPNSLLSNMRG